ncbi:hypothetical protein OH77DRAFT_1426127 [Trametes cingulata]|nr:hypothetical protein OH77DRAFT_1426127 [Trametes cingulata]
MVFNAHSALIRLRDNSIVLRDSASGTQHQFSVEQLRLFSRFDDAIRGDRIAGPGTIIPAGYDLFRTLWAQDATINDLAPRPALAARPAPAPVPAGSSAAYSEHQRAIVDDLIWSQLDRNRRQQEFYRQRRETKRREREDEPELAALGVSGGEGKTRREKAKEERAAKRRERKKKTVEDVPPEDLPRREDRDDEDDDMSEHVLRMPEEVAGASGSS